MLFFKFFGSPVAWKNEKKILPPRKSWNDAPAIGIAYTSYVLDPYYKAVLL